ncbi:hypothetical protein J3R83DRAFT_1156 [Lanmaoa asiatica]|nr:hypothetical protein J3R83DRAFT_1156 [Lanmaoa asiatica]
MSTIFEFSSLILLHRVGINHIPPGPTAVVFSILYQWYRLVPPAYHFRIFGVPLSNKSFTYILASQGRCRDHWRLHASGYSWALYTARSLLTSRRGVSRRQVIRFSTRFLLPLIGSTRPPRRLNRARPERQEPTAELVNEEVVTTTQPPVPTTRTDTAPSQAQGEAGSVMREWVNELTGRTEDPARIRTPSEAEISQLAAMFPDISRDLITRALQRTPNIEAAVEILLHVQ